VHLLRPGAGFNVDRAALDSQATVDYIKQGQAQSVAQFLLHVIRRVCDAFTRAAICSGDRAGVLFGLALTRMGKAGGPVIGFFESLSGVFFKIVGLVMRLAPIGAGGAMAFT